MEEFCLDPATVRRGDTSAASIDEWSGVRLLRDEDIPDAIRPAGVAPLGNYAAQIVWDDGFSQVAPYELLAQLPRLDAAALEARRQAAAAPGGGGTGNGSSGGQVGGTSAAQQILRTAQAAGQP